MLPSSLVHAVHIVVAQFILEGFVVLHCGAPMPADTICASPKLRVGAYVPLSLSWTAGWDSRSWSTLYWSGLTILVDTVLMPLPVFRAGHT